MHNHKVLPWGSSWDLPISTGVHWVSCLGLPLNFLLFVLCGVGLGVGVWVVGVGLVCGGVVGCGGYVSAARGAQVSVGQGPMSSRRCESNCCLALTLCDVLLPCWSTWQEVLRISHGTVAIQSLGPARAAAMAPLRANLECAMQDILCFA